MNKIDFSFADLIAGYVTDSDFKSSELGSFNLKTADERNFKISLTSETYGEIIRNIDEPYQDCTSQIRKMLVPDQYLFVYGIFYPEKEGHEFEAEHLVFPGKSKEEYRFEDGDWWTNHIKSLADFYLNSQFKEGDIDYREYRTQLDASGQKLGIKRQETDTISRLVYGFASAYMLTGEDRYLEAAEKGTDYLRQHMRFLDESKDICYWYHAIDVQPDKSDQKIFASEFGDDYEAIPAYEQIYALAGPTQTYRITGDPRIMSDIELTLNLFERHFLDETEKGGFFSHIDPITLSPHSKSLDRNRARKNWNSIGDHAPAYLINLWLATQEKKYADLLEYLFDLIEKHFPDFDNSPFVQERFYEDWSHDTTWGWQQNRAVVGHNLKIAWNLMRMYHLEAKEQYVSLAEKIAHIMPKVGSDLQRGGWYDVVERELKSEHGVHRNVWHNRKAWWQQEQVILAYLILAGSTGKQEYRKWGREVAAFYNAWFLDHYSGGIYFNVLDSGVPYLLKTERGKGSHSMSGYHSFELAYLSCVYTKLLINKEPIDLYFKPMPGALKDNILRVAPDLLPPGSVRLEEVWIDGQSHSDFDAEDLTVKLPSTQDQLKVKVKLLPTDISFYARLLEITEGTAKIVLRGSLDASSIRIFKKEIEKIPQTSIQRIVLLLQDLECISSEGLRFLVFIKQKLGTDISFQVVGANERVKNFLEQSEFNQAITMVDSFAVLSS